MMCLCIRYFVSYETVLLPYTCATLLLQCALAVYLIFPCYLGDRMEDEGVYKTEPQWRHIYTHTMPAILPSKYPVMQGTGIARVLI